MAAVCISDCAGDATGSPFRQVQKPKYVDLYKWAGSTADDDGGKGQYYFLHPPRPRVVDSVSCRQLYLRSGYTFSREESVHERTKKCFEKVKEIRVAIVASTRKLQSAALPACAVVGGGTTRKRRRRRRRKKRMTTTTTPLSSRVKDLSCQALRSVFQRLLSCTTSVDVVQHHH